MIGKLKKGKSFFSCISYCLEDKQELTEEKKQILSRNDQLHHKDRAEVLYYNRCSGDKYDLSKQFNEVRKLSRRCEKPVFHFTLSLAPGETLTKDQLAEIGQEAAKEFGVDDHQYICVLHKDTREQHIHIVANRVGFDGKAASDSNSYRRITELCRRLEKRYELQEVLSPRRFQSGKERLLPRQDQRKEKLKADIANTLYAVRNFPEFEQAMQLKGYRIIKGRGISFIDDKKVQFKGSDVGFSLANIQKILNLRDQQEIAKVEESKEKPSISRDSPPVHRSALSRQLMEHSGLFTSKVNHFQKLIDDLIKPVYVPDGGISPELLREAKKKKKRQRQR